MWQYYVRAGSIGIESLASQSQLDVLAKPGRSVLLMGNSWCQLRRNERDQLGTYYSTACGLNVFLILIFNFNFLIFFYI